jgi:protein-L-isoaspartate(D-aspartate) O-methyltransferase
MTAQAADAEGAPDHESLGRLIFELRRSGVRDRRVLDAIERTPRHIFVDRAFRDRAYEDTALPIACGQTISQPSVVGLMTQALALEPRHKVLEVGAGSGYQAAVLARLARRVYSIERHRPLAQEAARRLARLDLSNVAIVAGDGARGWPEQAPFDRILVTAAAEDAPRLLLGQLREGGVMVLPVGEPGEPQRLIRVTRTAEGPDYEDLLPVRFVPLLPGVAADEEG